MKEFPELQVSKTPRQRMNTTLVIFVFLIGILLYGFRAYLFGTEMSAKVLTKYYQASSFSRGGRTSSGDTYRVQASIQPNGPIIVLDDFYSWDWNKIHQDQILRVKVYNDSVVVMGYSSAALGKGGLMLILIAGSLALASYILNKATPRKSQLDI
jgi:hypothetical protein